MSLEEFYEEVADQWQERNFMGTGSVPRIWRTDRALHTIALPEEGWWVDIEHPDSIGAIEKSLTDLLKTQKIAQLDTSHLRSPNRHLTTAIAQWTREQVLFDGSEALGVIFGSRHGEYLNWAGWLRRKDQNQGTDNYRQVQSNRIPFNHSALLRVANRYGLKIF